MKIEITLDKLHQNQKLIIDNQKRFNVVVCGRRFGKTALGQHIIVKKALTTEPKRIAYFAPTYKMLSEVWKELCLILENVTMKKNTTHLQLTLINDSIIDFWSLDNIERSRGRKYHLALIDEASIVSNLENAWLQVIRPQLADYRGNAFFFCTPKGFYNYTFKLFENKKSYPKSWESFQMPTLANPYISQEEIEEVKNEIPIEIFRQEYLAEFVNFEGNLFADAFVFDKVVTENIRYNPKYEIYLSFDFNITNSVIVCQHFTTGESDIPTIYILKEYHHKGWDLQRVCEEILLDFPNSRVFITGDASGRSGSAYTAGNQSAYDMLKSMLKLLNTQIKTPLSNPSHLNSRLQTNILLKKANIKIHNSCKLLIRDLEQVTCNKIGKIDKSDDNLTHLLDTFRYYLWTFHYDTMKIYSNTHISNSE